LQALARQPTFLLTTLLSLAVAVAGRLAVAVVLVDI
jgi:hypothetical protein